MYCEYIKNALNAFERGNSAYSGKPDTSLVVSSTLPSFA